MQRFEEFSITPVATPSTPLSTTNTLLYKSLHIILVKAFPVRDLG